MAFRLDLTLSWRTPDFFGEGLAWIADIRTRSGGTGNVTALDITLFGFEVSVMLVRTCPMLER